MRAVMSFMRDARFLPVDLLIITILITGCGQVITLTPTPTPLPTATVSLALAAATLPPTSTPAPYTPAPTLTPTQTPTPVVHTIQSGESLLSIANQFNVSVAALQEANGILDPRSLQIGQDLVIPRPDETAAENAATPSPTPMPVTIENLYFSETSIGGLWILGEAHNTSGGPLEQLRVTISLLDAQGKEIAKADGLAALDLVDVNERSPFAILFGSLPGRFDQYRATASRAVPAYVGSYYRDLQIRHLEGAGERYSAYTVTGTIYNSGPEEAIDAQVVVTAYDALGRVIAMRKITPEYNVVPRGGETNFTAVLAPVGGPVDHVEAVAQGRRRQAKP